MPFRLSKGPCHPTTTFEGNPRTFDKRLFVGLTDKFVADRSCGLPMLIVGCSKRKLVPQQGQTLEAGSLYDGAAFRVFKAWQRRHPNQPSFPVLILSAKHGLVSWNKPLASYDLEMTLEIAERLRPQTQDKLQSTFPRPTDVYVEMGRIYLRALPELEKFWPEAKVSFGEGRIGERMRDLRAWLEMMSTRYEER